MESCITLPFDAIVITASDNVATCLRDIGAGERLHLKSDFGGDTLTARQDIPKGHKIALRDLACGEQVAKYGECIAVTTCPVTAGDHVHVHNLRDN